MLQSCKVCQTSPHLSRRKCYVLNRKMQNIKKKRGRKKKIQMKEALTVTPCKGFPSKERKRQTKTINVKKIIKKVKEINLFGQFSLLWSSTSLMYIRGGKTKERQAIADPPIRFTISPKSGKAKATTSSQRTRLLRIMTRLIPKAVNRKKKFNRIDIIL